MPVLVSVRALVSELEITPPSVMSPDVTPDRSLTRDPPMLTLLVRLTVPPKDAAVEELLSKAAWALTVPRPLRVPEPEKPAPAMIKGSAPTAKPFRSRIAPLRTVVAPAVSLRAAA